MIREFENEIRDRKNKAALYERLRLGDFYVEEIGFFGPGIFSGYSTEALRILVLWLRTESTDWVDIPHIYIR